MMTVENGAVWPSLRGAWLSGKLIDVLALEKNQQSMMTIENGSIWPSLQGAWFYGAKRAFEHLSGQSAEKFKLPLI